MKIELIKLSKQRLRLFTILLFIGLIIASGSTVKALTVTETGVPAPLSDEIEATLDWTVSTSDVDTDDYTMTTTDAGSKIHMPIPDAYIYSGDGETAVDTGTSYITLEESTVLGDYASESKSWSEYAFVETTFGSVSEGGDTAATSSTAPALSAGSSDVYISASADFTSGAADVGTAGETVYWVADVWNDVDGDGVDDSATVTDEEYIPFTKDVYILVVMKVDASDTDTSVYFNVLLGFYTGSGDYDVMFSVMGGDDAANANTHTWTYTDTSASWQSGSLSKDARVIAYETEGEYVAFLIDLADLIADDNDSSPNISGLNDITYSFGVADDYGDGSSDTVTGYVHNIAIFDSPPALTDDDVGSGNTIDYNGGATNTAMGDATNYDKHDIILPYVTAGANNDWDTRVYLENDIKDEQILKSRWHMLSMNGKMRIPPNRVFDDASDDTIEGVVLKTEVNEDPVSPGNLRETALYWDFDYKRESDNSDFVTSGFTPVLTGHTLVQVLDSDDNFVSSVNKMEESLISASLGSSDKYDDLYSSWDGWTASSTEITTDLWSTDPVDGDNVEVRYSYYTHESGQESQLQEEYVAFNWGNARKEASSLVGDNPLASFVLAPALFVFGFYKIKKSS